jgi:L-histidine Nalpha-methyltransferase
MAATATAPSRPGQFASDVQSGLSKPRKELPSKYFYDALGSALFEAICLLPEYGLTRADERILAGNAKEIVSHILHPVLVSELGSGNGRKTRLILGALCERGRVSYYPIEISPKALASCTAELNDLDYLSIVGIEREYLDGLRAVAEARTAGAQLFVLFLGSSIGNFDTGADAKFLREVRSVLEPGDSLLLGTDLIKHADLMLNAYNDSLGVTAAFNLNLLARINRELQANFDIRHFEHIARFNEATSSIEMHLVSKRRQRVHVGLSGFEVQFEEGESIWTETCHKYTLPEIARLAGDSGFSVTAQWVDREWPFAESLLTAG